MPGRPYAHHLSDNRDRAADRKRPQRRTRQVEDGDAARKTEGHAPSRQSFARATLFVFRFSFFVPQACAPAASRRDPAPRAARCRAGTSRRCGTAADSDTRTRDTVTRRGRLRPTGRCAADRSVRRCPPAAYRRLRRYASVPYRPRSSAPRLSSATRDRRRWFWARRRRRHRRQSRRSARSVLHPVPTARAIANRGVPRDLARLPQNTPAASVCSAMRPRD